MAKQSTGEMPFLEHLEELRWRIIWSLLALVIGLIAGFLIVVKGKLITVLQQPIAPLLHGKLIFTHPADSFSIVMNLSIIVGIVIASPIIIYQLWAFLSPALYRHEKRVVIPVILGAVFLFVAGVALAWFWVLPMMLDFLLGFQVESLQPMITASDYFSFVTTLALTFGAAFELPILVLALAALGLVTPKFLSKFRPYAMILSVVVAAIITPGDLFIATMALTMPLYLLYELSVLLTALIFRKKRKAEEAREATEPAEGLA